MSEKELSVMSSPRKPWPTRAVDWLGAQGAGNLTLYMISAITGCALIATWLE